MRVTLLRLASCISFAAPLPAQTCSYTPIPRETKAQHFADFVHDTASESSLPLTLVAPAATAAAVQYIPIFKETGYGTGADAFLRHYGVSLLDNVDSRWTRDFAFPVLFHQNPHYASTMGPCPFKERIKHVLTNMYATDDGKVNWSALPASAELAAASNLYIPAAQRTWTSTLIRIGTNEAGHLVGVAYEEFCPDLKKKLSFLPCPSKLQVPVSRKTDVFRK